MPWRHLSLFKSIVSVALSAALVALSPGFAAYEAAAATMTSAAGVARQTGVAPITTLSSIAIGSNLNTTLAPAQDLRLSGSLSAGIAPAVKVGMTAAPVSPISQIPSLAAPLQAPSLYQTRTLSKTPAPAAATPVAQKITGLSQQVDVTLKSAGDISHAGAEAANGVGARIESIMTGAPAASWADGGFVAAAESMGDLSAGVQLARPAGEEIALAAQAYYGKSETKVVSGIPEMKDQNPGPKKNSPFWPRVMASGLALLPAALLGWPLLAGGSLVAGGAVVLASVLLAVLPFVGDQTPKAVRVLPGAALLGLGALAIAFGSYGIGTLVALGGWGLMRYGKSPQDGNDYDSGKSLSAFFGGLGAITGAGLALLSPAGWLAAGLGILSYPFAALLLMHLPSWVGYGMTSAFSNMFESIRGLDRVESSLRRDTNAYERLTAYTRAQLKQSLWNAVWLAGIWVPIWLSQLVQWALSVAGGAVVGAAQAPVMFLWGAAHELKADSKPTKFLAAWAHFMFDNVQGAKKSLFNRVEEPLIPYANSRNKFVSLPATFAIRLLQWAWLAYAVVGTPVLGIAGFFRAFGKLSETYDDAKHDPRRMHVDRNDRPGTQPGPQDPDQPGQPGTSNIMPRLIAAGLALLPVYFLGLPLLAAAGPLVGGVYLAATLSLAALPFVPAKTPKLVRQLPGFLLAAMGLGMLYLTPVLPFSLLGLLALAKTNAFWMAALSIVGGWGLTRYLGKALAEGKSTYSVDDPEYIGAFFAAVAAAAGVGIVLTGLAGLLPLSVTVLAYLTSPLLLMHLPRWVFSGFASVFEGLWTSFKDSYRLVSVWDRETDFYRNLSHHARYWLDKSVWNGSWLSVIWVPMGLMMLADLAVSAALALVWGTLRAPFNYAKGAIDEAYPKSAAARFFSGFLKAWEEHTEGKATKESFLALAEPLLKGASDKTAVSGRPTLAAAASFLGLRLAQLALLTVLLLGTPLMALFSAARGVSDALKGEPPAQPPAAPASQALAASQRSSESGRANPALLGTLAALGLALLAGVGVNAALALLTGTLFGAVAIGAGLAALAAAAILAFNTIGTGRGQPLWKDIMAGVLGLAGVFGVGAGVQALVVSLTLAAAGYAVVGILAAIGLVAVLKGLGKTRRS
ncbi:MAG: hypothetical protein NTY77_11120 [Elusimicrobia bacterium]|nr:hypothetical protein [Elusimicrobiota bacterium]